MKAALYCRVSSEEQAPSGYTLGQQLEALREYCKTNGLEVVNGIVLAESEHTEAVEGNHYFPPESMNLELFRESDMRTHCTWEATGVISPSRRVGKRSRTRPATTRSRKPSRRA